MSAPAAPSPPTKARASVRVLARHQGVVNALGADETHAYWARVTGEILRAPLAGGETELIATVEREPMAIAVSHDAVCVAITLRKESVKPSDPLTGRVSCSAKNPGSKPVPVADGFALPTALVARGDELHWVAVDHRSREFRLFSMSRAGGKPTSRKVGRGLPMKLEVAGDTAYVLLGLGGAEALPLKGGEPERRYEMYTAESLAVSPGKVLLLGTPSLGSESKDALEAFPEAGGDGTVLAGDLDGPVDVVVSGDRAFVTLRGTVANEYRDGSVLAVPIAGGNPSTVASQQWQPGKIATTPSAIVWLNQCGNVVAHDGDAEIAMLPLPAE